MKALYVTDRRAVGDERFEALLGALRDCPGVSVQLREKDASDAETLRRAKRVRQLLGPRVPLLVNRRFDVALAAGADGVHLPAAGLPVSRVKANTPRGFRVGVSTHSAEQAAVAIEEGADLVVIGPIRETPSKSAFGPPLGAQELGKLPLSSTHEAEVYAIGGLDTDSMDELLAYRDRVAGIAGIRLFQKARDPRAVVDTIWRL